jgi:GntR family transcriptional regulator
MTNDVRRKHELIASVLASEIRTGKVRAGLALPGETSLARRFSVSRNTVRSALADLAATGLIETRIGKGSYVLFDGRPLDTRFGWAQALAERGIDATVRILAITATRNDDLARQLHTPTADFIVVERVRELAGRTISHELSHIPAIGPLVGVPAQGLIGGSLTATLRDAGLEPDHGEQRVACRPLDEFSAERLGRSTGEWFLFVTRTSWCRSGDFVEHALSLLDPEHFELHRRFSSLG